MYGRSMKLLFTTTLLAFFVGVYQIRAEEICELGHVATV